MSNQKGMALQLVGGKMRTNMLEIKRQEVRHVLAPYSLGQPL